MKHRHLLPSEIDLLLDGEEGFGVAPLKAHLRMCAECQARIDDARVVTNALEELPHFAVSHAFADRVMAQVPVFVPWHVAARDAVQRWMPQSRPARIAALALAGSVASMLTAAILWITTQTDLLVFLSGIAGSRLREVVVAAGQDALANLFGPQTLAFASQSGLAGLATLIGGFVGVAAAATFGLRAIALASSRRRS